MTSPLIPEGEKGGVQPPMTTADRGCSIPTEGAQGQPMTLIERLRNPQWMQPFVQQDWRPGVTVNLKVGTPDAILDTKAARATMDEAAAEIERLGKALELRNAEVVAALRWLDGDIGGTFLAALREIACFDDKAASGYLAAHGSYAMFDEPGSVSIARAALAKAKQAEVAAKNPAHSRDAQIPQP